MFGSRVSWLSWFQAYAECNPYSDLFVVTSDGTLGGIAVPVHPFPLILKLNRLDCDYIVTPVP